MQSVNNWGSEAALTSIVTIDDLQEIARTLERGLHKLGEYKYPLAIRKGVSFMFEREKPTDIVKAGAITYFFDVKETKAKKPYLLITESRFKGEGEDRERKTIVVFQENIQDFANSLAEVASRIPPVEPAKTE